MVQVFASARSLSWSQPVMKPYQKLQAHWQMDGRDIETRVNDEISIVALEEKNGVHLPGDSRDYLKYACPAEGNYNYDSTHWWRLDLLKSANEELGDPCSAEDSSQLHNQKNALLCRLYHL